MTLASQRTDIQNTSRTGCRAAPRRRVETISIFWCLKMRAESCKHARKGGTEVRKIVINTVSGCDLVVIDKVALLSN